MNYGIHPKEIIIKKGKIFRRNYLHNQKIIQIINNKLN